MAGTKIRTFLDLIKNGETLEAAIAASEVSPATAKIQLRKNGLTPKTGGSAVAKPAKAKKAAKKKVEEEPEEEDVEEDEESEEDEEVDLDDIA